MFGILKRARRIVDLFIGERPRLITIAGNRAYVEYRGIADREVRRFSEAVERVAANYPNVEEAYINPYLRRVIIRFSGPELPRNTLLGLVAAAEDAVGASSSVELYDSSRSLPDDSQLDLEYTVEAAANGMAMVSGIALRAVPFFPARLGRYFYMTVFLVSQVPRFRRVIDEQLGEDKANFVIHIAFAFADTLTQRPLSSLVALVAKLEELRELRSRRYLWQHWAKALAVDDTKMDLVHFEKRVQRQESTGPIERYVHRAWIVALGTFGFALITTRSLSRAVAAGFAALPSPARLGRNIFTAELGRVFARRGMLVLSKQALNRLDRVDCIVIPAELFTHKQLQVGELFGLREITRDKAKEMSEKLFSPEHPLRVRKSGGYRLGPVKLLDVDVDDSTNAAIVEHGSRGALVLGLAYRNELKSLVEINISSEQGIADAINMARQGGMRVVLASDEADAIDEFHPDEVIGYRKGLGDGIRWLQDEGHTVFYVGRGPSEGYDVADVGVSLHISGTSTPWNAHILCPDDPRLVEALVTASTTAKTVSEQSVSVAMFAAAIGALASTSGLTSLAQRRVLSVLNAASLASMINALRRSGAVDKSARITRDPTPWHALETEGVLSRLNTGLEGLTEHETRRRHAKKNGRSELAHLGRAIRMELMNPLSPLLAIGAGISAIVGSTEDAGIVAAVGLINGVVGGYQRYRTERSIAKLIKTTETHVHVRREGAVQLRPASDLKKGDIVLLTQGDVVPADCRIIDAESLEVDTSSLTGESLPVPKGPRPSYSENVADITSMLYAGNSIAAGRATAVVVATGESTIAQAAAIYMPDETRGGVESRLKELMQLTAPVAFAAGAALISGGMLRGRKLNDLVSTGVGLAVAAVPEGLPVLATAAQLSSAERLSKQGALVKNPRAIEALGRVDTLCMDKTGTLTIGEIELSDIYDGEDLESVTRLSGARLDVLAAATRAIVRDTGFSVDPMDATISKAAASILASDAGNNCERLAERAFESGRGFEAVLVREEGGLFIYAKGSPEQMISRAARSRKKGAKEQRNALLKTLETLSSDGLRVIAVGKKELSDSQLESGEAEKLLADPDGLTILGLLAFRDPARPAARAAVEGLAATGVRVVMITGDHPNTAKSIAREVGLKDWDRVMTGAEISGMSDTVLERKAPQVSVFARVTPSQKVRVVRSLQRRGHVVGMVGDGANDAFAMGIADAGIAVGKQSTEVARSVADIVLDDARIDFLFQAIVEGRAMWTSVRNAVSILVGGNLGEIAFTVAVGALTGRPPLSPRQLLVVNFLTDIAPSMAIALKPPTVKDLNALKEAGPEASLGAPLNREIVARAITTSLGAGTAWGLARVSGGSVRARTVGLVGLVGTQLGQTMLTGGKSPSVILTSLASIAALGVIVQTPGLSQIFGCTPLGPLGWSSAIASSAWATMLSPGVDRLVDVGADFWRKVRTQIILNRQKYDGSSI